ncbi:MAG: biotin--[acetyl-CoA-carboxylase] ligase [Planctomycetota bacterium]
MTEQADRPLLGALLRAPGPTPAAELAATAGLEGTTVVREGVERLSRAGCVIEHVGTQGLRLTTAGLGCWADYLERPGGPPVRVYRSIGSTQDAARAFAAHDRATVLADEQTDGRGRLGRRWRAQPGAGVLMSRVMHGDLPHLPLLAAMAVADAIEPRLRRVVSLKWPNDVQVDGRKLSGVLVESPTPGVSVVGIGLNVATLADAPPEVRNVATSLADLGVSAHRLAVIEDLIAAIDRRLAQDRAATVEAWRQRCINLDRPGRFAVDGRTVVGHVIDLDPDAGLLVRTERGSIAHLPAATTSCLP